MINPSSIPSALATPSDLGLNGPGTVAQALNAVLADSFALYLKVKNFHWHVSGAHFRDYHLMLDEQAAQILATTDAIAERVRKTGGTTLRSIGDIARHQSLKDDDRDFVDAQTMLDLLREDNIALLETLRAAKAIAEVARDNATSALIDEWTDQTEGRAWFLFESTRR
jgi:starvation-inducible DNA-binding protein